MADKITLSGKFEAEEGETMYHMHDVYECEGTRRVHMGQLTKDAIEAWREAAEAVRRNAAELTRAAQPRPLTRSTHTYATLSVPQEFHDFVKQKLTDASYLHALDDDGNTINMHGLALVVEPQHEERRLTDMSEQELEDEWRQNTHHVVRRLRVAMELGRRGSNFHKEGK